MWSKFTKKTFCWFPLPKRLKFYLFTESYKTLIFLMFCHVDLAIAIFPSIILFLCCLLWAVFFKLLPPTLSAISVNNTGSNLILASSLKTKENDRNHSGWHIKSERLKWFKTRNGGECFCKQKADTNFSQFHIFIYLSLFQQYKALYNQGYIRCHPA